jgi:hypothetical protein
VSSQVAQLQDAVIKQHCESLRMPTVASQFSTLAEQAVREKKTHIGYLEVLLTAEDGWIVDAIRVDNDGANQTT